MSHRLSIVAACLLAATAAAAAKPHIIMHLADDFGWANAGWHRPADFDEVKTPHMVSAFLRRKKSEGVLAAQQ